MQFKEPSVINTVSRRRFLRGAGGVTLALPVLPSLMSRAEEAWAAQNAPRRFICYMTLHGGVWRQRMYPGDAVLTESGEIPGGHSYKFGNLIARREGADSILSDVLRAPTTVLTDRLVSKMTVSRGWDVTFHLGHHNGGHLGNYASSADGRADANAVKSRPRPTIDQIMAWSPSFFPGGAVTPVRSIVVDSSCCGGGASTTWSNPQTKSGQIRHTSSLRTEQQLWNALFSGVRPSAPVASVPSKPVVDYVLDDYRRLTQSSRRLSSSDRTRVDAHISLLADIQRQLAARAATPVSCAEAKPPRALKNENWGSQPNNLSINRARWDLINKITLLALQCDITRVAAMYINDAFFDTSSSWHQDFAHQWKSPGPQNGMTASQRNTLEHAILPMVTGMDRDDAFGNNMLDDSVVLWSQECGEESHEQQSMPMVTFGGAGGYLQTGKYFDLRRTSGSRRFLYDDPKREQVGVPHQRLMATMLLAMGIPESEWRAINQGDPGYGVNYVGERFRNGMYAPQLIASSSTPVPAMVRS